MGQSYTMPSDAFERLHTEANLLRKQLVGDRVHATEVFSGRKAKDVYDAMDARRAEIEAAGGTVFHRAKIGRNSPCLCGSGLKFKKCCIDKVQHSG